MKIPTWFLTVALVGFIGWASWTTTALIDLKTSVVKLETKIERFDR